MWDIYKNCDPKDDDNWSFGMLFCWAMFALISYCTIVLICQAL